MVPRKERDKGAQTMRNLEFFARCAGGFEEVLGQELRALHMARVRPQVGGVIFFGSLADGYRACMWSHVATRIQLVVARVPAASAEALYRGVLALPWEDHVPAGATIAVDAHGENPELRNTKFTALKVKDAICDRLRAACGMRPNVDAKAPDLAINVAVHPQKATVYLNLSGASLHRRGYRADGVQTEAPLKETLAAGILLAAGWPDMAAAGGALVDPMCGSGTFAIEAALMAASVAPGLLRKRWGFEGWRQHDQALWDTVRSEAELSRTFEQGIVALAGDMDSRAVDIARANAQRAGVDDLISFYVDDAANLKRHLRALRHRDATSLLAVNPPYGQRLLSGAELPLVRAALVQACNALPKGWRAVLVTPDMGIDTALGRSPEKVVDCFNGPLRVLVRTYDLAARPLVQQVVSLAGVVHKVSLAEPASVQFAARLRKAGKERARWARKEGVSCYRVYDADLPDFALTIDLYETDGSRHAVVEERRRPHSVDELGAERRFADAVALVAAVLDVPTENLFARPWQDRRRTTARTDPPTTCVLDVCEGGHRFAIDLNGKPDTGLPLALRGVRELVEGRAAGKRVANLFASTGAASVYAAAGGANVVVTVDSFADRVEAVRAAMRANGFVGKSYRYTCEDARTWLEGEKRAGHVYDLVICVPPTWLAARKLGEEAWELQRDHIALLRKAVAVLGKDGAIVFACQDRAFKFDASALQAAGLQAEDVSPQTLPHDFERSAREHHCYLVKRSRSS